MKKIIFSFILIIPIFVSCTSLPVTVAQQQIDTVLDNGWVEPAPGDTDTIILQKKQTKAALVSAKETIQQQIIIAEKAKEDAKNNESWAKRGKIAAVIFGLIIIGFICRIIFKIVY